MEAALALVTIRNLDPGVPCRDEGSTLSGSGVDSGTKRGPPDDEGGVETKGADPRKRRRGKVCSTEGCTSLARNGGLCLRHGARRTRGTCSHKGCANLVQNLGLCFKHGAKYPECSHEGCTNGAIRGGVCWIQGAKQRAKLCIHEGCLNKAVKGGVCHCHVLMRTR